MSDQKLNKRQPDLTEKLKDPSLDDKTSEGLKDPLLKNNNNNPFNKDQKKSSLSRKQ